MAFGAVDVAVRFMADASSVNKEMEKVKTSGDKAKTWAKGIGAAIGGAFAVDKLGDWINAAEEANAADAALAKTLQNAGDATGQWAKHAEDLAGTLQAKTGIDDEVIKGGQAILGTFHEVAGAAGQQSGAFDRATQAALDMSKAGFGSVEGASTMLGKALNDPLKGITALGRAGVTFSEDQKAAIKAMVESGDQAGAMNEVLKNVEGQVGGVAEATATSGDKMKVAWGETQESLGKALLPVLAAIAPKLQAIAQYVQENATWLVPLVGAVLALVAAYKVFTIIQAAVNAVLALFGVTSAIALGPLLLIILGIAALVAAVWLLYQNWDTVWSAVQVATEAVVGAILAAWDAVLAFFGNIPGWIETALSTLWAILIWPFQTAWDYIAQLWGWITDLFQRVVKWIADYWPTLLAILTGPFGLAVLAISQHWDSIIGFVRRVPGLIADALSSLGGIIVAPFQWAWEQIQNVTGWISDSFGRVVDGVKNIWNGFARGWNGLPGISIPGFDLPGPLPDFGGLDISLPHLPQLSKGGIVSRPTLALIGERGPEAVVPLGRGGFGTIVINVTSTGLGADSPAIQSAVTDALRQYVGRNGPITGIT